MKEEVNGTQNPNPEEGKGTKDKTQRPEWLLDKYATAEEQAKAYTERDKQAAQAVEQLRKLETEKETSLESITGANTEIEELKKQLAEAQKPPSARRYNPVEVKKYEALVVAVANGEEGAAEQLLDYNRGLAIYDRQMEDKQKAEVANKRETQKQWGKIKEDYGVDTIREIAPEIGTVLEKYPDLRANAHENPDAMRDVVRLAEKMHEEKAEARKAEQELRDAEKEQAGGGSPSGGGKSIEDDEGLSLKQLEEKYGWNPEGGPIPE